MIEEILKEDVDKRIESNYDITKVILEKKKQNDKLYHVVYVMSNTTVCGAAKVIFEHANRLISLGNKVTVVAYFPKPNWFNIECNYIQVPCTTRLSMCIPFCDLIVATYYTHIGDCVRTNIAPVIYFEQGDYHLFHFDRLLEKYKAFIKLQFSLANSIITVSNEAAKLIKKNFAMESHVIYNAIDNNTFNNSLEETNKEREKYLLIMGSDKLSFKGIQDVVTACRIVKTSIPEMKVYWITPVIPSTYNKSIISKVFIAPSQKEIARLYQNAEMFISGSHYESFSLPVLEAMACGCPVITTDSIGVRDYVVDNHNALVTKIKEPYDMAQKIIKLINNDSLKKKLIENGLKTVEKFNWNSIINELNNHYKNINMYQVNNINCIEDWTIRFRDKEFDKKEEYLKFIKIIQTTKRDKVYIPVIYKVINEFSIARWELAAYRNVNSSDKEYCYTKVNGDIESLEDEEIKNLYKILQAGEYTKAIEYIRNRLSIEDNGVYNKWLVYCLIKTSKFDEAIKLLNKELNKKEKYSDLYLLYLLILSKQKHTGKVSRIIQEINILGDGIVHEEFIVDIISKAEEIGNNVKNDDKNIKEGNVSKMEEMYDYAMRLFNNRLYDEAINSFIEFTEEYENEKEKIIQAYRKIYLSYYYKQMYDESRLYCYLTFKYTLPRAEECCFIGFTYLKEKNYDKAIFWYELATNLEPPRNNEFTIDKDSWTWKPYVQLCVCHYQQGNTKKAFKYNEIAKSLNPYEESILQNVEFFKKLGYKSNELL
ncbi:glycosyltransferase family 4 protein [Vallitalea guaymasensis]|uniref:Glycosyltransferase family 4 protein n=1 Tax=Vallitalea guaymasensis TaxID=1185412 RepID=A0A8J8MC15_9FIRM|nr:glycosyltransferase family 4 protein [Vallitalea guaymasensis]QUH30239.1 glycosyltransferase family 4 protein [Vallitalea guaymasensis]